MTLFQNRKTGPHLKETSKMSILNETLPKEFSLKQQWWVLIVIPPLKTMGKAELVHRDPLLLFPRPQKGWVRQQAHLTLRADEATHVLHHPDDGQLHLVTEVDFFPDILEGHLLSRFKRPTVSRLNKYKKENVCLRDGCNAVGYHHKVLEICVTYSMNTYLVLIMCYALSRLYLFPLKPRKDKPEQPNIKCIINLHESNLLTYLSVYFLVSILRQAKVCTISWIRC